MVPALLHITVTIWIKADIIRKKGDDATSMDNIIIDIMVNFSVDRDTVHFI